MKRGGQKSGWIPKNNQSSPNSARSFSTPPMKVDDQSSSCKPKNVSPCVDGETRGIPLVGSVSKCSGVVTPPNVSHKPFSPVDCPNSSSSVENLRFGDGSPAQVGYSSVQFQSPSSGERVEQACHRTLGRDKICESSSSVENLRFGDGSPAQVGYSSGQFQSPSNGERVEQARHRTLGRDKICESSELDISGNKQDQASQQRTDMSEYEAPFDICNIRAVTVKLKPALHLKNREKRLENKRSSEGLNIKSLRPGMVLLKHYISVADQVKIIEKCRKLGRDPGGFYQPSYRDGEGKLHLKMMCLGKNWDSRNSKYIDVSPADGAKTLPIPGEFHKWVDQAIRDSHDYLRKHSVRNIEETLPSMTPDICIVNFYSKTGRLGLHQDKDESKESLRRGLPVVSISIGDSAEFVYGDQRDLEKAEKVVLESGDLLIFGGSSRHIFHGVTTINGETAPKVLLEESNLRPGRLNLTFRQF